MSGHSKWKKIKRQKEVSDLKKGDIFTKLGQAITVAVREGGERDPDMNFMLRIVLEKAREANMPNDNIERAIKKGLGLSDEGQLISITYEIVGKGGIAILVDCLTNNKNRTISELRKIVSKTRSFSIGSGIRWQFEEKGRVIIEPLEKKEVIIKGKKQEQFKELNFEEVVLEVIEIEDVEDVVEKKEKDEEDRDINYIYIFVSKENFKSVYNKIEEKRLKVVRAEIVKVAKNKLSVNKAVFNKVKNLINLLEECLDVVAVWTNVK